MTYGNRPLNEQPVQNQEPCIIEYDVANEPEITGWQSYRVHQGCIIASGVQYQDYLGMSAQAMRMKLDEAKLDGCDPSKI